MIYQEQQTLEEKATGDTVESVIDNIDALTLKLDKISMNIVS